MDMSDRLRWGWFGRLRAFGLAAAYVLSGGATAAAEDNPDYDPACLTITRASATTYLIENAECQSRSVLAAIELAGAHARCFTKKIRTQISIASEQAAPIVYYQCIEGLPGCTIEELHGMFPECRAG
jgi:hypothetical protein